MEMIQNMIRPELLILVPVLYFAGTGFTRSESFPDRFIPLILGVLGAVLAMFYGASTVSAETWGEFFALLFTGITQGVLCAGASVYVNQLVKQHGKGDDAE